MPPAPTPTALTPDERETLNAAMAIIEAHTVTGASWQLYADGQFSFSSDVTYFDSARRQHSHLSGATFADKVAAALERERDIPSPEERKAARIEALRKELATLADEPLEAL